MQTNQSILPTILTLAFVAFIDTLGLAILYPILNPLFYAETSSGLFNTSVSFSERNFFFGLTLMVFPLATFFAAPLLGDLSDRFSRKKILLLCLVGTFFSYALAAISILFHSIGWFIASRILAGLTAGSQPIAQAAIIDISNQQNKTYHLSLMILAISFGYTLGPLMSSLLIDNNIISSFSLTMPLILAGLLSFINIIFLILFYKKREKIVKEKNNLSLFNNLFDLKKIIFNKKFRQLSYIYFILQLSWGFYFQFVSVILSVKFSLTTASIGQYIALIAIGFSISSLYLVKLIHRYLGLSSVTSCLFILAGGSFILTNYIHYSVWLSWFIPIIIGASIGILFSYFLALFSEKADDHEQGTVMGLTTSISAIALVLSSVVGSYFMNYMMEFPLYISSLLAFSCLFFILFPKQTIIASV